MRGKGGAESNFVVAKKLMVSTPEPLLLPQYLHQHVPDLFPTITASKKATRRGLIRVNGDVKSKTSTLLHDGDLVEQLGGYSH